jgi:hypothetical protein
MWHADCVDLGREADVTDLLANLGTPFFAIVDFVLDKPLSAAATASMLATLIVLFVAFR